jgi:DNA-binding response OmpR family regulator
LRDRTIVLASIEHKVKGLGFGVILLDLNLPDISGFEVLRSLRVSKVRTPILILSGPALSSTPPKLCFLAPNCA